MSAGFWLNIIFRAHKIAKRQNPTSETRASVQYPTKTDQISIVPFFCHFFISPFDSEGLKSIFEFLVSCPVLNSTFPPIWLLIFRS
ncbi:hypothetical protein PanWU01x14_008180 [Parasponia andersonii]|uniref:Uncharacterized protein n=1 Tax=Parasponia andersonii TaxID=3476 RepID=A0A2P5E498_PARAD|nr:hypothetical protein PanWU01x14_008180 [Parasponia andersonii]